MRNIAQTSSLGNREAPALSALAEALAPYLAPLLARATTTAIVYSQLDGQRAPGAGHAKHLRVWHAAAAAGDPGATKEGRARLLTADAWARWCDALPSRARGKREAEPVLSIDDQVAAKLGVRRSA